MKALFIPLVFGEDFFGRISQRDDIERNDPLREREERTDVIDALLVGIEAGPHGTKPQGFSSEKDIFRRSRTVLDPELAGDPALILSGVSADNDRS